LDGLAAAGYYQAAIAVAGSLPAVVFGAMGTDFFPRVAAAKNEAEARFLSEKQIQAGLLLALPLLTALLTMGAVGLRFLYDARFEGAEPMLAWMIWGVFLRLLAWPLGYWMLAKGSVRLVVIVEVACSIVMVILPAILIPLVGEVGAASSYLISYAIYSLVMLVVSKLRSGEWISAEVFAWFAIAALWLLFAQAGYNYLHGMWWGVSVTAISLLACSLVYYRTLRGELVKPIEPLNLP
jgi:PST family polysaccharide transporter